MLKLAVLSLLAIVHAAVVPTSPDGSTVVKVGSPINALWNKDTTAGTKWNNMQIQLMTGDNLNMVALQTVATGIDGTRLDSYSFNAPEVSPYSKIYFLQFTAGGDVSTAQWTTRFTIAGPNGETTTPSNSTVYNGNTVQWGTGVLLGSSGNSTSGSSAVSSSASASASSAASAAGSVSTISVPASSTTAVAAVASASASASSVSAKASSASSAAGSAAAAATSKSAAGKVEAGMGALLLGVAGALLL